MCIKGICKLEWAEQIRKDLDNNCQEREREREREREINVDRIQIEKNQQDP